MFARQMQLLPLFVCVCGPQSPIIPYEPEKLRARARKAEGASRARAGDVGRAATPLASSPLPESPGRGEGGGRRAGPGDARSGPERRWDAGPLTLLAPEAAGDQAAPLGALSPGVGAGLAGTGYRTDLDDLSLRHFLPARRFPDETRSQVFPFPLSPPFHFLNGRDAATAPVPPPGA